MSVVGFLVGIFFFLSNKRETSLLSSSKSLPFRDADVFEFAGTDASTFCLDLIIFKLFFFLFFMLSLFQVAIEFVVFFL